MLTIEGVGAGDVRSASFDKKPLKVFVYDGRPAALVGVDLNKKPGTYTLSATLISGETMTKEVVIGKRERKEAPLGIPEKLGGNTKEAARTLVSTLAKENAQLSALRSGTKAFWSEPFKFPVKDPVVTDHYGYSRATVQYQIAHKGTDFRAKEGTPVYSMNRGVVRFAKTTRNYGKTVVVDHGLGLMTMYMHLSKIRVNEGELVRPGQLIGDSGQTGYVEAPHLHLSVRIDNVSIDPMKFLALFGSTM